MTVVVTFAMDWEFGPWRRVRVFRRGADGGAPAFDTRVGRVNVRVVLTGIGRHAAAAAAGHVFHPTPDFLITSGTGAASARTFKSLTSSRPAPYEGATDTGATAIRACVASPSIAASSPSTHSTVRPRS